MSLSSLSARPYAIFFFADHNGPCSRSLSSGTRPVQKHKRTQDWRAGPFRSSSTHGEPQIWGVSEAMSAIRVPRTRRENTVQQRDARHGPHLDQNVLAGYAAVALALILDPSGGLFSDAARPCQRPAPPLWRKRGTRKSRLETKTENEASSALLARLW